MTKPDQRKRYSREVRRSMFLDEAAKIIANRGVAGLTLEQVAVESSVSKSLIYNYFDSVTELLKELHVRELKALHSLKAAAVEKAETFEEMIRGVTHTYLSFIEKRGLIFDRLQSEVAVSGGKDPTYFQRRETVNYLATLTAEHFDIPVDLARKAIEVSYGMPAAAGEYLLRGEVEREELEDITVAMIIGSITYLRNDYLVRQRKLRKQSTKST
ncbi:TetR/AcrR family transcriptional regulator [Exilibacterium tricleocarpae]|uniref:TetR/AcrR family transcriptional regulator n=1 Tax=Exilibacterium tricleocarpae TaxID=2591008 RepID=A0A545TUZ7_9GAMM|nr:TetR/AcrR family transcriptional regulator [Exilibacterium tricleocarpae]TQV81029.1 TetR/AcrR family transcriptional regulator [Exilibacterium tricleocarpae]